MLLLLCVLLPLDAQSRNLPWKDIDSIEPAPRSNMALKAENLKLRRRIARLKRSTHACQVLR